MALILNIDTSTKSTSVALAKDSKLIGLKEEHNVVSHASKLTPFIESLFSNIAYTLQDLDAIAISIGPGSYTGLRIGLSVAKGLCYTLEIPILAISGLEAMLDTLSLNYLKNNELFVSVMNSRKNEVYCALLDKQTNKTHKSKPVFLTENFLQEFDSEEVIIAGTGLDKVKHVINKQNVTYDLNQKFSAKNMMAMADKLYYEREYSDLAYLEPEYLKPFITT